MSDPNPHPNPRLRNRQHPAGRRGAPLVAAGGGCGGQPKQPKQQLAATADLTSATSILNTTYQHVRQRKKNLARRCDCFCAPGSAGSLVLHGAQEPKSKLGVEFRMCPISMVGVQVRPGAALIGCRHGLHGGATRAAAAWRKNGHSGQLPVAAFLSWRG